jgi:uncharacterized membrane protein
MHASAQCLAALAILTLAASTRAQTPSYSVKQIGPLPGDIGGSGLGINNSGSVIGLSEFDTAFHWTAGSIVALPALPGAAESYAEHITDDGIVLGYSLWHSIARQEAVAWSPSGGGFVALGLGMAPGDNFSSARGMGKGVIAGCSDGGIVTRPVVWLPPVQPPGAYTLVLLPLLAGDYAGIANGVDSTGRAYGFTANAVRAQPTRWTLVNGVWNVVNLGTLAPNYSSEVNAVAPNSLAVGYCISPATGVEHAVLWESTGIADLGALNPGWRANAEGVNNLGDVVGSSGSIAFDTAWVRPKSTGVMVDLETRLPAGTSWDLSSASDIADDGRIIATGYNGIGEQALLLTPVSTFLTGPTPGIAGQANHLSVSGATPGGRVRFIWGYSGGETAIAACPSINFDVVQVGTIGSDFADAAGNASVIWLIPPQLAGQTVLVQALDSASCRVTNVNQDTL